MKRKVKVLAFYLFLLSIGPVVVASDIIMGHHAAARLSFAFQRITNPEEEGE